MSSLTPSKVKLVLLGDTAVGKTCIVQRYVNDDFTDDLNSTIGGVESVGWYGFSLLSPTDDPVPMLKIKYLCLPPSTRD